MIVALDHVQIAMPRGAEDAAREYYGTLLGLRELAKPAPLQPRGGVWFQVPDGRQIHLGVEEPFRPQRKAHPCFIVNELDTLATTLQGAGESLEFDEALPDRKRFFTADVFGNRLEFLEKR